MDDVDSDRCTVRPGGNGIWTKLEPTTQGVQSQKAQSYGRMCTRSLGSEPHRETGSHGP